MLVAVVAIALSAWPDVGEAPDGARQARDERSAQWHGDRFANPLRMSSDLHGGIGLMLRSRPGEKPDAPVPTRHPAAPYAKRPASGLRMTWFDPSSSLIEIDGAGILVDPIWSARASPFNWLGSRRFFPPVVPLTDLPPLEVVVVSHDHYDHFDRATIQAIEPATQKPIVATLQIPACTMSATQGKPFYGTGGIDRSAMDSTTRPGDDFFRYANGSWLDHTAARADRRDTGVLADLDDRNLARVRQLIEEAATHAIGPAITTKARVGAFYRSYMDRSHVDALGSAPLTDALATIRSASSRDDLVALMGRHPYGFEGTLFHVTLDTDMMHPDHYAVYVGQDGLGMPGRDYYLKPEFSVARAAYRAYAATLLMLVGWPDAKARADDVLAFENRIAKASWSGAQQDDSASAYHPVRVADLQAFAPGFDWKRFLEAARLASVKSVVLQESTAVPRIASIFRDTPLPVLRAWAVVRLADHAAPYLSQDFVQASFAFHGHAIDGVAALAPAWQRGVRAVAGDDCTVGLRACFGSMGWAVGDLYVARYFPPAAKRRIEDLVANLTAAFRSRIEHAGWMSDATREEALRKLASYKVLIGSPDTTRDYSRVAIRTDDLMGNVLRVADVDWSFTVARLARPLDQRDWVTTPLAADANNGTHRDIDLPAALMQPPWFDVNADSAVNYGAIGVFIAHELTHGFDNDGRTIDARGARRDWWTPADAAAFDRRAAGLGRQYARYEVVPGVSVDAEASMGENIADLGGMAIALDAYHASLHHQPAPVVDGLTGDQRFFLAWAQGWREKKTDAAARNDAVNDPHPPPRYRVDGPVRNIDAWYAAFGVKPGDRLWLAPKDRVTIW